MSLCRACSGALHRFLDLGMMPLSGRYVTPGSSEPEHRYDLVAARCQRCALVQLAENPPPDEMFTESYTFFSSSSRRMQEHFHRLTAAALSLVHDKDPLVVEIGCNDGVLLSSFRARCGRVVGIDPAANAADRARQRGLQVETAFFNRDTAAALRATHGPAALVVATNAISHIPDIAEVFDAVRGLLGPGGLFIFEEPYWPSIRRCNAFDQIYDEHVFYFSAESVTGLGRDHGLSLVGCSPQPVHGGSMRYVLATAPHRRPQASVEAAIRAETLAGASTAAACAEFADGAARTRRELPALLRQLRDEGVRVGGYGATAKSSTLLNFCGIGRELLLWIADTTPEKQGRLAPGSGIPIVPPERFHSEQPGAALLLAWNHAAEIAAKERGFAARGGRWIVHIPEVRILDDLALPLVP